MDAPEPRTPPTELTAAQRIAIALGTAVDPDQVATTAPAPDDEADAEGPPGAAG